MEHVAREALGVDAHERRLSLRDIPHHERDRFFGLSSGRSAFEAVNPEVSKSGREVRFSGLI